MPTSEILCNFPSISGIVVGHVYYFLEDVFPNKPGGLKLLRTPQFLGYLFDPPPEDNYMPAPEERPGGFDWGDGEVVGVDQANQ